MTIEILMPALSPTMEEGTLAKWLVKEGDEVSSGDILAEIETDKATMEFEAVDEGKIGKILVAAGTQGVKVNQPIALLLEEGETEVNADLGKAQPTSVETPPSSPQAETERKAVATPPPPQTNGDRIFATPLARRLAAEKNIDLSTITGSGPHGRIIKADIEGISAPQTKSAGAPSAPSAPTPSPSSEAIEKIYQGREYETIELDGMRRTVAARLTEAKQTIPHFYLRRDIKLDALLKTRAELNKGLEARGIKLSVNDFIIKACAVALQIVPDCNAVWAGDRILRMKASDVAVAVAVDGGLFTPVIHDADSKTLSVISTEMKDLATRARERKLTPDEYIGGSFAISNLGMFGIDNFDAVINPPQGSILAVGAGVKKPVIGENDEITISTIMSVTLSVDHRVIDGALGAEFLNAIKNNLENPMAMLA